MRVIVEKISNNVGEYKTPLEMLDGMPEEPKVGKRLILTSSEYESGGIITSEVTDVRKLSNNVIVLDTKNSTYIITVVKE